MKHHNELIYLCRNQGRKKVCTMWNSFLCSFLFVLNISFSLGNVTSCVEQETPYAILDTAEDAISKAKNLYPDCAEDSSNSSMSICTKKGRSFAFLDVARDLISEAKKSYHSCRNETMPDIKSLKIYDKPMDCTEVLQNGQNKSGVYTVWPRSRIVANKSLDVYCDMDTDGGEWTVIQRRGNFTKEENFYRNWVDYKLGFGDIQEEFWIGNDNIFLLSNQGRYVIRFDLQDASGVKGYAVYRTFWIDDEQSGYTLHIGNYIGNLGDSLNYHNNMKFTTYDRKNDKSSDKRSCSEIWKGGWWYNQCQWVNLNGLRRPGIKNDPETMNWKAWRQWDSLGASEIKIRRI